MSIGRQEAFEIFKRDYFDNAAIEDKKKQLKRNYNEAKTLGETINNSRNNIIIYYYQFQASFKMKIEQLHLRLAANDLLKENNTELDSLKKNMEQEKEIYKHNFEKLRQLKNQIEHLQHLIECSQIKLQKDFENWWMTQCEIHDQQKDKAKSEGSSFSDISTRENSLSSQLTELDSNNTSRNSSTSSFIQPVTNSIHREKYYNSTNTHINNAHKDKVINLTGNQQIDNDINEFINARQKILNQMNIKR